MKTLLLSIFVLGALSVNGQNAEFSWANGMGGTGAEGARGVTTDASGNVYSIGYFSGTADFDPGPGTTNLSSLGSTDLFIQKTDPSGNLLWAKHFGGTSHDDGLAICVDPSGNVYATGNFRQTVDFDPGAGTFNLTAYGNTNDLFILKLNTNGDFVWVKKVGLGGTDIGQAITANSSGDVFIGGRFQGTVDFDPNAGVYNITAIGSPNGFILKLDASGNFVWAKHIGGSAQDQVKAMTLDASGNLYTTGIFASTIDFDTGVGVYNLTATGGTDTYVLKLNTTGDFVWARRIGGSSSTYGNSIAIDPSGNTILTGWFSGLTDFNPDAMITQNISSVGSRDIYVLKLDVNGDYIWVKSVGGTGWDEAKGVDTDDFGNVYCSGQFGNTVDFDPGVGTVNLTASGTSSDIFIQKLDGNGDFVWVKQVGASGGDVSMALNIDAGNNVYASGNFSNTVDFDPGTNVFDLISNGSVDAFVLKLSQPCFETVDTINACNNYTWIDGITYSSSNSSATHTLTSTLGCDSIVTLDLTINTPTVATDVITACNSHTWIDGITYTSSNNTASHTLTNALGCDSIITLNLTINSSNSSTYVHTACDSFTWIDGITYTSSNNSATHLLTNVAGCDSTVTLDLTIINTTTGTDVQTACDSFVWIDGITYTTSNNSATIVLMNAAGCDSTVTLNLEINNSFSEVSSVVTCDPYTWIDGNTYTASNNTASYNLQTVNGCDSTYWLDLTIVPLDLTVSNNDPDVVANHNGTGSTYQWIDCDNGNQNIVGATNQVFTPTNNGNYACVVDNGACSDTTDCIAVTMVGIDKIDSYKFVIAPNPTSTQINIQSEIEIKEITISNLSGQLVLSTKEETVDVSSFETGVYLLTITTEKGSITKRFIKE